MRDWRAFVRSRLSLPELPPERQARIVRELAAQLEDFYREALARGASPPEADAHAAAQIRDWARMAADLRQADRPRAQPRIERLTATIDDFSRPGGALQMFAHALTDIRYATRQWIKTPGFSTVAVLTLAFGTGATTAIFSLVNGVMLRPLPYPDPARLVRVFEVVPEYGRFSVAPANFLDWRQQNGVFERMAAYVANTDTFAGAEGPERLDMAAVSWDVFDLLGIRPALGRGFTAAEDLPKQNNVIVLSDGMWQRRFGADPGVLGRSIQLGGAPVTIVGVMPPGFHFPGRAVEYWRPIALDPVNATRGAHFLSVIARLKPHVSAAEASAAMKTLAEGLARQYPDTNRNESIETIAAHDLIVGPVRPMLLTLLAAVAVVVLIACANVANLLLVRASVREKEIAIRAAMGAGRRRLVMQMLAESVTLALFGGALGVLLAWLALDPIRTLSAGSIPRVADVALDRGVLAFAFVVSVATGILFGLAPAWQASRGTLGTTLKEGGRSSTSAGHRLRSALLVAEVALSLVLLVGATLLLRSFAKLSNVDPGFRPENVLAFRVALQRATYPEPHHRIAFYRRLLERLRTTPGVAAAGMVHQLPIRDGYMLSFSIDGRAVAPGDRPSATFRSVSPGYFGALRIPIVRGRGFTAQDSEKAPMVALVDEAFVRRHFPNEDPIGRGLDIGNNTDGDYRIVGIVGDVRHDGLALAPSPTMYVPFEQDTFSSMWMLIRTTGNPDGFAGAARLAVREIDPALPAFAITTLTQVIGDSIAERRFSMMLLGVFALVALFLAAVGLYGVVAYTVSRRTQEIGVRMAIGAGRGDVLRLVLRGGMKLAVAGVAIGLAGALALARLVATMLFGVTPFDPVSYVTTAAVLIAISALACYVPARRAMDVDPLVALRSE